MAEELRNALPDHPGDPFVLCWLGAAERGRGWGRAACARIPGCLAARPMDPPALATAGSAPAAFCDPAAAAALRAAAHRGSDVPRTRWLYGAWLVRRGL